MLRVHLAYAGGERKTLDVSTDACVQELLSYLPANAVVSTLLRNECMPSTPLSTLLFAADAQSLFLNVGAAICGGKGGFGSMLRAQGGRMSSRRPTNTDACRDLSGRRLKSINEAKKLADQLEKIKGAEEKKEERIKRKIDIGLRNPSEVESSKKIKLDDPNHFKEKESLVSSIKEATRKALQTKAATVTSPKIMKKGKGKQIKESEGKNKPIASSFPAPWENVLDATNDDNDNDSDTSDLFANMPENNRAIALASSSN